MNFRPIPPHIPTIIHHPFCGSAIWLGAFLLLSIIILFCSSKSSPQELPLCTSAGFGPSNPPYPLYPGASNANCAPVSCSTLTASAANSSDDAVSGANCHYMGLPPCKTYTADTSKPRENCADIIDLPLCSAITGLASLSSAPVPGVNCVNLCSDPTVTNPTFNTNCTISCSDPSVIDPLPGVNCRAPYCHQITLADGTNATPSNPPSPGTNCNLMACNLLTVDEVSPDDNRFVNDSGHQYCDGSTAKCYDFFHNNTNNPNNSQNLQHVLYRKTNTMCQIHNCPPSAASCSPDDTLNITDQGTTYTADYQKYINATLPISGGLCKPLNCQPIVPRFYACLGSVVPPDVLNPNCDSTSVCTSGYCVKTIDCNLATSSSEPECQASALQIGDHGSSPDIYNAWLFRPTPPSSMTNGGRIISSIVADFAKNDNFCYDNSDLQHDLSVGWSFLGMWFDSGTVSSPGHCSASKLGFRGNGYMYLAGTGNSLYNQPSNNVGYIKGIVSTNHELDNPAYNITACLRYQNSGRLSAAGANQCSVDCAFGYCGTQWCGFDVCRDMKVYEQNNKECASSQNNDLFTSNGGHDCASDAIDGFVRMRAIKYGRKVCVFLDLMGTLAYDPQYFNGSETLSDDGVTCVDNGLASVSSSTLSSRCSGFNTNDDWALPSKWRTIKMLQYIGNNQQGGSRRGYVDNNGIFYPEQDCALVPLRVGLPRFYNVANLTNSQNLFAPPLYIKNANVIRGGRAAASDPSNRLGATDFFYPEIVVQYGDTLQPMSLGAGDIGGNPISGIAQDYGPGKNDSNLLRITPWSATLTTTFNGAIYKADVFVAKQRDVNRNLPIFCLYQRNINDGGLPLTTMQIGCVNRALPNLSQVSISGDSKHAFNGAILDLQLIATTFDGATNRASGDKVRFTNPNVNNSFCANIEQYQFCSTRDPCSQLLNECAQNQVNLHNAAPGSNISQYLDIQKNCNTTILNNCNTQAGLTSTATDYFSQNTSNTTVINPNAYGWFNEICITSGFDLPDVYAYLDINGVKGKCVIDVKSALNAKNNNCSAGGNAALGCFCQLAINGVGAPTGTAVRRQTSREAGLCIDIAKPQFCPAISYNHAEYPSAMAGMSTILGTCNNFWRVATDNFGIKLPPLLSCQVDGTWELASSNNNSCVRYSCPAISADSPADISCDSSGSCTYSNSYGASETGDNKGSSNGFATWPQLTKTNDFLENATATGCITGFQPSVDGNSALPTRTCKQNGAWDVNISNACVRITCPDDLASGVLVAPQSSAMLTQAQLDAWSNNGGASFPQASASRSSINPALIVEESVAIGTCNNSLGFYQVGSVAPTRACSSSGAWQSVQHPCATDCSAVTNGNDLADGYATWSAAPYLALGTTKTVIATACIAGYVPNPYAPIVNGTHSLPTRSCSSTPTVDGGNPSLWGSASYPCLSGCVSGVVNSANYDPAEGRGITTMPISTGEIALRWPTVDFGADAYIASPDCTEQQLTASSFIPSDSGNNSGCYLVKRHCNRDGSWSNPIATCSLNGGQIGNASYSTNGAFGNANSIAVGDEVAAGTCVANSYGSPKRQCVYGAGTNIDQVRLQFTESSSDCAVSCPLVNNQKIGVGSIYNGGDSGNKSVGSFINLVCQSGYGNAISGGSNLNVPSNCGLSPSDRTTINPTATCQANGNWVVTNDCSVCRSCATSSPILGNGNISATVSCCSFGFCNCKICTNNSWSADYNFNSAITALNMLSGQEQSLTQNNLSKGYCGWTASYRSASVSINFTCADGTKVIHQ